MCVIPEVNDAHDGKSTSVLLKKLNGCTISHFNLIHKIWGRWDENGVFWTPIAMQNVKKRKFVAHAQWWHPFSVTNEVGLANLIRHPCFKFGENGSTNDERENLRNLEVIRRLCALPLFWIIIMKTTPLPILSGGINGPNLVKIQLKNWGR